MTKAQQDKIGMILIGIVVACPFLAFAACAYTQLTAAYIG